MRYMTFDDSDFPDCDIRGVLWYGRDDLECLTEDMLQVELPNGIVIDVGWYPESSPRGSYRITARLGPHDLIDPIPTPDVNRVANDLATLVPRLKREREGTVQYQSDSDEIDEEIQFEGGYYLAHHLTAAS